MQRKRGDRAMYEDLKNEVVVVTWGAKGIGSIYVSAFGRAGSRVVAADIAIEAARGIADEVGDDGGSVIARKVDVADQSSVAHLMRETADVFGGIDVLINNASLMSVLPRRSWIDIPFDEWERVMAVNVQGVFLCCLEGFPYMRERGRGKIVNISSNRVLDGTPNRLHYTTSKAAVIGFTRALAREVGEYKINVNAVTPGLTLSETQVASSEPAYLEAITEKRCIKRNQVPEDLVGTVMFLSSSASDFISGQTINVDGGQVMH